MRRRSTGRTRARAARASSAAEAERTAAEGGSRDARAMQSVQASLQAELEWRSSEMEGWGSRSPPNAKACRSKGRTRSSSRCALARRTVPGLAAEVPHIRTRRSSSSTSTRYSRRSGSFTSARWQASVNCRRGSTPPTPSSPPNARRRRRRSARRMSCYRRRMRRRSDITTLNDEAAHRTPPRGGARGGAAEGGARSGGGARAPARIWNRRGRDWRRRARAEAARLEARQHVVLDGGAQRCIDEARAGIARSSIGLRQHYEGLPEEAKRDATAIWS